MNSVSLYFDNAATSHPKPPEVLDAVVHYHRELPASAGRGGYREAVEAGRMLGELRASLARFVGASSPERVIFTLNGTDALNLAIKGFVRAGDHVVTTAYDHNSVLRPLHRLEGDGVVTTTCVPPRDDGMIHADDVVAAFRADTRLVVMSHASNVTGAIAPAEAVGRAARARGIAFLLDAAQSVGRIPVDVEACAVDLLAFPGHKALMGPQGTGVLWIRDGVDLRPLREGGTGSRSDQPYQPEELPDRFEPGAHNGPGLAGLLAAVRWFERTGADHVFARHRELSERLFAVLAGIPGAVVPGPASSASRIPIHAAVFPGRDPLEVAVALDRRHDVKVRGGFHCAPLAHRRFETAAAGGAVRFAPGWFTTDADLERLDAALRDVIG